MAEDLVPATTDTPGEPVVELLPHSRGSLAPAAALPRRLQDQSFDEDIWNRVKAHPIRNPSLSRNNLGDDPETREIVRQVIAAANEREKEVLLHNQARVFQEVLGRVVHAAWDFMSKPVLPLGRRASSSAGKAGEGGGGGEAERDEEEKQPDGFATSVLNFLATPKNLLLVLTVFLGATTGYSQLQLKNLQDTIASYQSAADASEELKARLAEAIDSAKADREELQRTIDAQMLELAQLRNEGRELDRDKAGLTEQLELSERRVAEVEGELKKYKEEQADDVKALDGKLEVQSAEIVSLKTDLAQTKASLAAEKQRTADFRSTLQGQEATMREKDSRADSLSARNAELLKKNSSLQKKVDLLSFAETCIESIDDNRSWRGKYDNEKVTQYLAEYEKAKENLGF